MKKILTLLIAVVMCMSVLAGCGAAKVNLGDVMSDINTKNSLTLKELSSVDDLNTYYSIDTADVKQFAAEIDSNSNAPTEIILVEAVDSDAADRVEKALTARYNSIYSIYSSYSADKLDMVKACKVTKDGNFVSLIVADKAPSMLDTYYESVQK